MPEARENKLTVSIEPTFRTLLDKLAEDSGVPTSIYARKLIVSHLKEQGILTPDILYRMATTDSTADLEKLVEQRTN